MQVQKQKRQKKRQLWHPFTIIFFVFLCLSLPTIDKNGRVLHVPLTCFHANTEIRHHGGSYTWALVASCKDFCHLLSDPLPASQKPEANTEAEICRRDVRAGRLLPESWGRKTDISLFLTMDLIMSNTLIVMNEGGGKLTGQLCRESQSSCFWISCVTSGGKWEWHTGRLQISS